MMRIFTRFSGCRALAPAVVLLGGCANVDSPQAGERPDVLMPSGAVTPPEPVLVTPPETPGVIPAPPTPTPPPDVPTTPQPQTYVVQAGDTLWSIAVKHYGNGQKWKQIADANPGLDPSKMPVGKPIILP